jgi:hypothetical protein
LVSSFSLWSVHTFRILCNWISSMNPGCLFHRALKVMLGVWRSKFPVSTLLRSDLPSLYFYICIQL